MADKPTPIPRTKPASSPEVVQFCRELIIKVYQENVSGVIVGTVSESGYEVDGMTDGTVLRLDFCRTLDLMEEYIDSDEYIDDEGAVD